MPQPICRSKIVILTLILITLGLCQNLSANAFPSFPAGGPSVSWVSLGTQESGYSLNWDTAVTFVIFSASCNVKLIKTETLTLYGAQAEFTVWFFANLGGGAGYLTGDWKSPVFHLFAGFPIPLSSFGRGTDSSFFLEPYYRLNWMKHEIFHELGIFYKFSTY